MFERDNFTPQEESEFEERFDIAQEYWAAAIREGRSQKTEFYTQLFASEETQIYRERGDKDLLFYAAKTLDETWIGINREGRPDTYHLPASPTSSSPSASGGSTGESGS